MYMSTAKAKIIITPNDSFMIEKVGAILTITRPNNPTRIIGIENNDFVLINTPAPITASIIAKMSLKDVNK